MLLDKVPPDGYYTIGNQFYKNKQYALIDATKKNQEIHWNFHDSTFNQINWTQRPPGTLSQLYCERAQQIRDTYDYVTVWFSGGSDSWTVLNSFLSNGIHVDEVFTSFAFAARKVVDANIKNTDSANLLSEYEYAALPVLDYVRKNFPNTKVVVDDSTANYQTNVNEESLLFNNSRTSFMASHSKFGRQSVYETSVAKKHKKIAQVLGADKLMFGIENNNFYTWWTDSQGSLEYDENKNMEFFFSTPAFPTISVLQAHCLKDYFQNIVTTGKLDPTVFLGNRANIIRNIYSQACYPEFNTRTFQVDKQPGQIVSRDEFWVKDYNPRHYEKWRSENLALSLLIDKKYHRYDKNAELVGYRPFTSKKYLISELQGLTDKQISFMSQII